MKSGLHYFVWKLLSAIYKFSFIHWSAPLVSCGDWSDCGTESQSGSGPSRVTLCFIKEGGGGAAGGGGGGGWVGGSGEGEARGGAG